MTHLLLALALACGTPTAGPSPSEAARFPHPAGYAATHGADSLAFATTCASCHPAEEPVESAPSAGPACASCHAFPHPADFRDGATHGPAWKASPANGCPACHGADGARAPAGVADATCASCHASYPHPAGWAVAQHGRAALERGGPQACASCHDGRTDQPTCDTCHAAWPHSTGWITAHGDVWRGDNTACGAACHLGGREAPAPPACGDCHTRFPHPEGWSRAHIRVAEANGEASCAPCHAPGALTGPALLNPSCGPGCHGGTP